MAASLEIQPSAPSIPSKHHMPAVQSCPSCGTTFQKGASEAEIAQRRVTELEGQMELLKEKATAAVDRCADYEDQLRDFKTSQDRNKLPPSYPSDPRDSFRRSDEEPRPATAGAASTKASRFSFLTGRRPSPVHSNSQPAPLNPAPVDLELRHELERERTLRAKAEERVQKVDIEIEELSVQLFSQANEMVATERKARAKLEERIEMLERKDKDKMARLDRLEKAVCRIDRVKAMLNQPQPNAAAVGTLAPPTRR